MTIKHIRLRVTEDFHAQVKSEAAKDKMTLHEWIVEAMAHHANRKGKKRHGHQGD